MSHIGAKGITTFLLCRLGLAKAKTNKAFNSAQWKVDIDPLSDLEMMTLHANVISRLKKDKRYGGYDAIEYMMGKKTAEMLAKNSYVNQRPTSEMVGEQMKSMQEGLAGSMKRMEREWEEEKHQDKDEYVSAEMAGNKRQKRKMS